MCCFGYIMQIVTGSGPYGKRIMSIRTLTLQAHMQLWTHDHIMNKIPEIQPTSVMYTHNNNLNKNTSALKICSIFQAMMFCFIGQPLRVQQMGDMNSMVELLCVKIL
jgi:hypothetical protein